MDQLASGLADWLSRLKWFIAAAIVILVAIVVVGSVVVLGRRRESMASAWALDQAKGERELEEVAEKYPGTWAARAAHYRLGARAYESGDYDKSVSWLRKVIDEAPSQDDLVALEARLLLTYALEKKGELIAARREAAALGDASDYDAMKWAGTVREHVLGAMIDIERQSEVTWPGDGSAGEEESAEAPADRSAEGAEGDSTKREPKGDSGAESETHGE